MHRFLRKLILFFVAFSVIRSTVDFSTKPFEPLRAQWEVSTQHVISNRYYQEYLAPIQDQYFPVVYKFQDDHIKPAFEKVNHFVVGKYRSLLSGHVKKLSEKVVASPVYQNNGLVVIEFYQRNFKLFRQYTQLGFEETAKLTVNAAEWSKVAYVYIERQITMFLAVVEDFCHKIDSFYRNAIIPGTGKSLQAIVKGSLVALKQALRFFLSKSEAFIQTSVKPFLNNYIYPKVHLFYVTYLQKHYTAYLAPQVEFVKFHTVRVYNLLRVQQILNLSKNLLNSSYDQLKNQFSKLGGGNKKTLNVVLDKTDEFYSSLAEPTEPESVEETPTEVGVEDEITQENTQTLEEEDPQETADTQLDEETPSGEKNVDIKQGEDSETEIEITLATEIESWEAFITETVNNIFKNFDRSIDQLEKNLLDSLKPELTDKLQKLSFKLGQDYSDINKLIYNIDSHPAVLENGEPVYLDKAGKVIDHEISREEFRELLNSHKGFASTESDNIHEYIISQIKDLEKKIDSERKIIVDIYEEFAEVAINEFSKKMMYSSLSNSFNKIPTGIDDLDDDFENLQDWKHYIRIKNSLIQQREDLISKQTDLKELNKFMKEIQETLKAFVHEAGDYYSILRAKANIEFQEREGREARLESLLEDEDYTIKKTIVRQVTQTVDDNGVPIGDPVSDFKVDIPEENFVQLDELDEQEQQVLGLQYHEEPAQKPVAEPVAEPVKDNTTTDDEFVEDEPEMVRDDTVADLSKDEERTEEQSQNSPEEETYKVEEQEVEVEYEDIQVHESDKDVVDDAEDIVQHQPDE